MDLANQCSKRNGNRVPALGLALMLLAGSVLHTAPAHANGYYWGNAGAFWGAFAGGLLLGAAFAPRYYYGPGWYPPPVVAAPPPVYYAPPAYYGPPVVATAPAPVVVERGYRAPPPPPAIPRLSVEERLQRLKRLCDQALLTRDECRHRRELIARDL
jgi:hypothetical protein